MTREERHIAVLSRMLENMDVYDSIQPTQERKKAIKAAIKALEQEPTGNSCDCDWVKMTYEVDSFPKGIIFRFSDGTIKRVQTVEQTEQEPCDDTVSRDAVNKEINCWVGSGEYRLAMSERFLHDRIKGLPPVQPKRQTGKWIGIDEEPHEDYECSCCGYVVSTFTANIKPSEEYKFCPNCGAKMVEPQERSE